MSRSDETRTYARSDPADEALVLVALFAGRSEVWTLPRRGKVTLGRDPKCDVVVNDPSVAPVHAQLELGERVLVRRTASGAETRVEGLSLGDGESAELAVGAIVDLGQASLLLQRRGAAPSPGGQALSFGDHDVLVGGAMATTYDVVRRGAAGDLAVLVLGETGVGKDVFAERIHQLSRRAAKAFVRVNAAALAESLFESELFGHEQGAFTGALRGRAGLLETADGGTVFFDEIGELPPAIQVKLLRVIDDRRVTRVGGVSGKRVDVRFVAATNRDLAAEVAAGTFRKDLYHRLRGVVVEVPPLRARRADIPPLAVAFLERVAPDKELADDALRALAKRPFWGNVRELRNVIERSALLARARRIEASDIVWDERGPAEPEGPGDAASAEAREIKTALARCDGNQTAAAKLLGISRRTLVYRLSALALPRPRKG